VATIQTLESLRFEEQSFSSGSLTLEADSGESLMVHALGVEDANANDTIQVAIDEETMLAFQHDANGRTLFQTSHIEEQQTDILGVLRDEGLDVPKLKVPEGDELRVINDTSSTGSVTVAYSEMGPQAVRASEEGGPGTKTRTFVSTGRESVTVGSGETVVEEIDTSANPGILRDWPYEEDVPPQVEYDLQALGINVGDGSLTGVQDVGFRLQTSEREFLARDSAFIDVDLAPHPDGDLSRLPLVFAEQPTFEPGDDLTVEVTLSDANSSSTTVEVEVAIVAYRRDVGGGV
jgi:hypothetical protein